MSNYFFGQTGTSTGSGGLTSTDLLNISLVQQPAWNSLHVLNQNLATTSSPSFYDLTISNTLKLESGAFKSIITPSTLTGDHTLYLPDSDLTLTAHSGPNQALSTNNTPTFSSNILLNTYTNSLSHAAEELSKISLGHAGFSCSISGYLPQDSTVNGMSLAFSTPDNTGALHRQMFIGSNDGHSGRVVIGSSTTPTERLCVEGNIRATGSVKLDSGAFTASITPLTLTGNTTLYLPDSNVTLTQWSGPNQQLDTTGTPTFADLTVTDRLSFPDFTAAKNMTLVGYQAGGANALTSYSHYSTLVGYQAGSSLNGALNSTAIGWKALTGISTGSSNTALGCSTGITLTTGQQNTLVGAFTDVVSSGSIYSIGLGYGNLLASGCIFIGRNIGSSIQSGATNNVVIGSDGAGGAITSGASNLLLGQQAGYSLSSGNYNVSAGFQAGSSATTGDYNTCLGYQAGSGITTGAACVALGYKALATGAMTGYGNVAIGHSSMSGGATTGYRNTCVGIQSGLNLTAGNSNTCIGDYTGTSITSDSGHICLGAGSNISSSGGYAVAIGYNASAAAGTVYIGTTNAYSAAYIGCGSGWTSSSDARLKTDIDSLQSGMDIIKYIKPRKFRFKDDKEKRLHFGFIAQEMMSILPQAVTKLQDDTYGLTHNMLLAPIVRALQELSERVELLEHHSGLQGRPESSAKRIQV